MQKIEKKKAKARALVKKLTSTEPQWGPEQDLRTPEEQASAIRSAFNYYNSVWDGKKRRSVFLKHLTENNIKVDLSSLRDDQISGAMVMVGRMRDLGCKLTDSSLKYYQTQLAECQALAVESHSDPDNKPVAPVVSIQERVAKQLSLYIGAWEEEIDKRVKSPAYVFDATAWLQEQNVKPMYAKGLTDWFQSQANELRDAIDGCDSQLVEGYKFLGKDLKPFYAFVQGLADAAKSWAGALKQAKEPQKRAKKMSVQIKHIKYKINDPALNLVSIDPAKILEAESLWTYNTKTRMLSVFYANDSGGLGLKGTTIQNFSDKYSGMKKLRKPKDVLPLILSGKRAAGKCMNDIRAKFIKLTGRINSDTILLVVR